FLVELPDPASYAPKGAGVAYPRRPLASRFANRRHPGGPLCEASSISEPPCPGQRRTGGGQTRHHGSLMPCLRCGYVRVVRQTRSRQGAHSEVSVRALGRVLLQHVRATPLFGGRGGTPPGRRRLQSGSPRARVFVREPIRGTCLVRSRSHAALRPATAP